MKFISKPFLALALLVPFASLADSVTFHNKTRGEVSASFTFQDGSTGGSITVAPEEKQDVPYASGRLVESFQATAQSGPLAGQSNTLTSTHANAKKHHVKIVNVGGKLTLQHGHKGMRGNQENRQENRGIFGRRNQNWQQRRQDGNFPGDFQEGNWAPGNYDQNHQHGFELTNVGSAGY